MKYLVYILTFLIWIGSTILSFFAGLITMEVINRKLDLEERNRPRYGHIAYRGPETPKEPK